MANWYTNTFGEEGAFGWGDPSNSAIGGWGDNSGQRAAAKAARKNNEAHFDYNQSIAGNLDSWDDHYVSEYKENAQKYRTGRDNQYNYITGEINTLKDQATNQANDARQTYTNTIRPNLTNLVEQQMKYAGDAMSLKEAGNPNNSIHTAVRDMYNKQGEGVRQQGIADFGVLSALGAQAAAGQMGNVPMTAGAMSSIYGANQSQAAEAFANAQRRVFDLQQQGIDRGFEESDKQYARGERERDRAAGRLTDLQNSEMAYQDSQGRFRGEIGGYADNLYGLGMGRVADDYRLEQGYDDLRRDTAYGKAGRQTAIGDQYYTGRQQNINNEMARMGQERAGQIGLASAIITGGMTAAGSMYGPGGAMAGNKAGQGISQGIDSAAGGDAARAAAAGQAPAQGYTPGYGRGGYGYGYQSQGGGYQQGYGPLRSYGY